MTLNKDLDFLHHFRLLSIYSSSVWFICFISRFWFSPLRLSYRTCDLWLLDSFPKWLTCPLPPLPLRLHVCPRSVPRCPVPPVVACTGEAASGRPGVGGEQHDKDHCVWSLRAGYLVPLSVPWGICSSGEALHVWVLPEVHEEPDHSAQAHGKCP